MSTPISRWIPSVYTPVPVSTYSPVHPSAPDPKAVEIASLITELYTLFIDMRYLPASFFSFPPHAHVPVGLSRPASYGITKDVVDLWQMIPHHNRDEDVRWNYGTDAGELIAWGGFLPDLRSELDPDASWPHVWADPFYGIDDVIDPPRRLGEHEIDELLGRGWEHERGPYMRPWYAVLNDIGNHGSMMILDTKTWEIWLLDALDDGSRDPVFAGTEQRYVKDHGCTNEYDPRRYPSRPATEFFQDIINRYKTLEWIPGGLYDPEYDELPYKEFRTIYKKAGWPSSFDPIEFDRLLKGVDDGQWNDDDNDNLPMQRLSGTTSAKEILERLSHVVDDERQYIRDQIDVVNKKYELAYGGYDEEKRHSLGLMLETYENEIDPPPQLWKEIQGRIAIELDFRTNDLEALRTRTGRYAGVGWAGVPDKELKMLFERKKDAEEHKIATLKAQLGDENLPAKHLRVFQEARKAAASLPATTWQSLSQKTLIPDVGSDSCDDLEIDSYALSAAELIRDSSTLEELRGRLLQDFDSDRVKNRVDSKKWEAKDGVVVMALPPNFDHQVGHGNVDLEAGGWRIFGWRWR